MIRNPWIADDRPPPVFEGGLAEVRRHLDDDFPYNASDLAEEDDFEIDAIPFDWSDSDDQWRLLAACRGEGTTPESISRWYPPSGGKTSAAAGVAWCEQCPVKAECGEFADRNNINSGIWGGEIRHRDPQRKRSE